MISDNGPRFVAKDFKEFIRISGMTHVRTSPFYPRSNGKLERNPLAHLIFHFTEEDPRLRRRVRGLLHSLFDKPGTGDLDEVELTQPRHHLGTCRMGGQFPDKCGRLRVHDCPNLYQ